MSWPAIAMYAVVACLGLPAALRNPTAAVLVVSWLAGETTWLMTGNNLPLSTYFMADVAVIAIIYAKTIWRIGAKTYPTIWRQLYCLAADLTVWDRWIVGLFILAAWPLYILALEPYYRWWALYLVVIVQFMLAGIEAVQSFRHSVKSRAESDPPGQGLALAGVYRGHG